MSKKIVIAVLAGLIVSQSVTAVPKQEEKEMPAKVQEPKEKVAESNVQDRVAKELVEQAKVMAILDTIVSKRPQIVMLLEKTKETAIKVCLAIDEYRKLEADPGKRFDEKGFVAKQKAGLQKLISKFISVVLENASMLKPIMNESIGGTSKQLGPLLDLTTQEFEKFFENIDTTEKLYAVAYEAVVVLNDIASVKNLKKSMPAYQAWKKEQAEKKKKAARAA